MNFKSCSKRAENLLCALVMGMVLSTIPFAVSSAHAQDEPCQSLRNGTQGSPEPIKFEGPEGQMGMWFPMDTSRLVLCEVKQFRLQREQISLLQRELKLRDTQADFMERRLELSVSARNEIESVLAASERRARRAENRLDHWSRDPTLWFAVGVGTAILMTLAASYAVGR